MKTVILRRRRAGPADTTDFGADEGSCRHNHGNGFGAQKPARGLADKILRSRANDCVSYNSARRSLRMTRFRARFGNNPLRAAPRGIRHHRRACAPTEGSCRHNRGAGSLPPSQSPGRESRSFGSRAKSCVTSSYSRRSLRKSIFSVHRGFRCTPRVAGNGGGFTLRDTVSCASAEAGHTGLP